MLGTKNQRKPYLIFVYLMVAILSSCIGYERLSDSEISTQTADEHSISVPAQTDNTKIIQLPKPDLTGTMTLEETLAKRRSTRSFLNIPLTDVQISQLLWAAQGITHPSGFRTAPSAGALYPLEIYTATSEGAFHYNPVDHILAKTLANDPRPALYQAALQQDSVLEAPLVIVISAVFSRTSQKYGDARTPQYVFLEAGHAAQNILLQAVALDLGAVPIGAFDEIKIKETLLLPNEQSPLYVIPIGHEK